VRVLKPFIYTLWVIIQLILVSTNLKAQSSNHGVETSVGGLFNVINFKGTEFSTNPNGTYGKVNNKLSGQNTSIVYFWKNIEVSFNVSSLQSIQSTESKRLDFNYNTYGITGGYSFPIRLKFLDNIRPFVGFKILDNSAVMFTDTHNRSLDSINYGGSSVKYSSRDKSIMIPFGVKVSKYLGNEKYWRLSLHVQIDLPTNQDLNPIFKSGQFYSVGLSLSRKLYIGNKE